MVKKVNIAAVGCGLWGKNLIRNFYNLGALHTVCDLDPENLKFILTNYPEVNVVNDFSKVINNPEIDGVVIATPSHTHYKLVKLALSAGKNVYVEKPIATQAQEAKELNNLAGESELVLMVGHLLLYHPAVNRLKSLVENGELGDIVYVQSDRLNINLYTNDRSVMWDLAPHDVSMASYVTGKLPESVKSAVGCSSKNNGIMDIVHLDLIFEDDVHVHISNSWIHPAKRVVLMVKGTKATAVLDDTLPENKLQIYETGSSSVKIADSPDYLEIEPLKLECQHFISCIINKTKPRSDGTNGYEVVKILEDADKIMLGNDYNKISDINFAASRVKTLKS